MGMKILYALVASAAAIDQAYNCVGHEDASYVHALECKQFIQCVHGVAYVQDCPLKDTVWNPDSNNCEHTSDYTCNATTREAAFNSCKGKAAGDYPAYSVAKYFTCDATGNKVDKDCTFGTSFDVKTRACAASGTSHFQLINNPEDKDLGDLFDDHLATGNKTAGKKVHGGGSGKPEPTPAA